MGSCPFSDHLFQSWMFSNGCIAYTHQYRTGSPGSYSRIAQQPAGRWWKADNDRGSSWKERTRLGLIYTSLAVIVSCATARWWLPRGCCSLSGQSGRRRCSGQLPKPVVQPLDLVQLGYSPWLAMPLGSGRYGGISIGGEEGGMYVQWRFSSRYEWQTWLFED